jgi:hypothetical protein
MYQLSDPFPHVHAVEMIDSLAENFKMRFSDFYILATNTRIVETPFSCEVCVAP